MKKLLIVEDEVGVSFFLQKSISRQAYRIVDMVFDGQAAIAAAKKHQPDVILMDIHIRGPLDGIETVAEIRRFSDVPVIYLTALLDPANEMRIKQTTWASLLVKPVTVQRLDEEIRLLLA